MSVLGPLFVPRKDVPPVPKIKDNPELEKYLTELGRRIHTNELAIQRWANTAPRLAAVVGGCSPSAMMNSAGVDFQRPLPLDGPVNAYYPGIIDASNSAIVFPQAGWYLISATVLWDTGGNPGLKSGSVEVLLYPNGNTAPLSELTSSGTSGLIDIAASATYTSLGGIVDYQTLNYAGIFNAKDYVQLWGLNFVFFNDTLPPGVPNPNTAYSAKIITCAIQFLGATPSKVQ